MRWARINTVSLAGFKKKFLRSGYLFVLLNSLFLFCNAFEIQSVIRLLPQWLRTYGIISGGDNIYSFFAPGVSSLSGIRCRIVSDDGLQICYLQNEITNNEVLQRFIGMNYIFIKTHPSRRVEVAESIASYNFYLQPQARQVTVTASELLLPSLAEAVDGKQSIWVDYFESTFERE